MSNADVVRAYFHAWRARDADAILATFNDGGRYEDPGTGGPISGPALRGYVTGLWAAFPDLDFEEESLGEIAPDRMAAQWVMTGTNSGSMGGLPPTGKSVRLRGADFFALRDGRLDSVTGYFDSAGLPRQIGLNVIVQPHEIGPFRFGVATSVQTGRTDEPGAFSVTALEAIDDDAVQKVRDGSRDAMLDMLNMDGFIGATAATIGRRMVTVSAWTDAAAPRRVMRDGAHARVMGGLPDGTLAETGFTSVWVKHHVNPVLVRCGACGRMTRGPGAARICACGAQLPGPTPYW